MEEDTVEVPAVLAECAVLPQDALMSTSLHEANTNRANYIFACVAVADRRMKCKLTPQPLRM
jgi:hypothetical protein